MTDERGGTWWSELSAVSKGGLIGAALGLGAGLVAPGHPNGAADYVIGAVIESLVGAGVGYIVGGVVHVVRAPAEPRSRRTAAVGGVLAVIVLLIGIGWAVARSQTPSQPVAGAPAPPPALTATTTGHYAGDRWDILTVNNFEADCAFRSASYDRCACQLAFYEGKYSQAQWLARPRAVGETNPAQIPAGEPLPTTCGP